MWKRFLRQAQHGYSPQQRLAVLLAAAVRFVVILPLALLYLGRLLDRTLGWPALLCPPVNAFVGGLMILAGWLLAMWTIYNAPSGAQLFIGSFPVDPSKRLDGLIDQVGIYDRAFSTREIQASFLAGSNGKCR